MMLSTWDRSSPQQPFVNIILIHWLSAIFYIIARREGKWLDLQGYRVEAELRRDTDAATRRHQPLRLTEEQL